MPGQLRGVSQTYRVGPARRPVEDPSYRQVQRAFEGNGLRPYAPAHLRGAVQADGALSLSWIRRTRVDGDAWEPLDVPVGEESESYLLRVIHNGAVVREASLSAPAYVYGAAEQVADAVQTPFTIEVAQISASYGPGPSTAAQFT